MIAIIQIFEKQYAIKDMVLHYTYPESIDNKMSGN